MPSSISGLVTSITSRETAPKSIISFFPWKWTVQRDISFFSLGTLEIRKLSRTFHFSHLLLHIYRISETPTTVISKTQTLSMAISCAVLVDWKRLTVCTKKSCQPNLSWNHLFPAEKKGLSTPTILATCTLQKPQTLPWKQPETAGRSRRKTHHWGGEAEVPHQPCTRLGWECHSPPCHIVKSSESCQRFKNKVDLLLMEEILQQLIGSWKFIPWFMGFIHPRWCRISSINSMTLLCAMFSHALAEPSDGEVSTIVRHRAGHHVLDRLACLAWNMKPAVHLLPSPKKQGMVTWFRIIGPPKWIYQYQM